jgi:DNA-directed RNA polymerase sigma subunit (sigma70/sigma32)
MIKKRMGDRKNAQYNKMLHEQARERATIAIKLHKSGKTWQEIGCVLGVTRQRAQQLAKTHMQRPKRGPKPA